MSFFDLWKYTDFLEEYLPLPRFGVFDNLKSQLTGPEGQLSPVSRMLCGLCAGIAEATLVVTWIETLKVRLISDQKRRKPRFRGLMHAATTIVREEVRADSAW